MCRDKVFRANRIIVRCLVRFNVVILLQHVTGKVISFSLVRGKDGADNVYNTNV